MSTLNTDLEALERLAKFPKGVSADPTKNMAPEDAAKWQEMNEMHGDKFKNAKAELVALDIDLTEGSIPHVALERDFVALDEMGRLAAIEHSANQQVAGIILDQMGGSRRLAMMIGAKNFLSHNKPPGVSFQFMRTDKPSKTGNFVKITLDEGTDTYDIEFGYIRGMNYRAVKKLNGIYADQLGSIFRRQTGLALRLASAAQESHFAARVPYPMRRGGWVVVRKPVTLFHVSGGSGSFEKLERGMIGQVRRAEKSYGGTNSVLLDQLGPGYDPETMDSTPGMKYEIYFPDIQPLGYDKPGVTLRAQEYHFLNGSLAKGKRASEDEKEGKFEEGESADPTENMSEEDAKKWRLENLKHKDDFDKKARGPEHLGMELWGVSPDDMTSIWVPAVQKFLGNDYRVYATNTVGDVQVLNITPAKRGETEAWLLGMAAQINPLVAFLRKQGLRNPRVTVQSMSRISPDFVRALQALRREGKLAAEKVAAGTPTYEDYVKEWKKLRYPEAVKGKVLPKDRWEKLMGKKADFNEGSRTPDGWEPGTPSSASPVDKEDGEGSDVPDGEGNEAKRAGKIKGPGVPDGTGPGKDSPECPVNSSDKEAAGAVQVGPEGQFRYRWPFVYAHGRAEDQLDHDIVSFDQPHRHGKFEANLHTPDGRKLPAIIFSWKDGGMDAGLVVLKSDRRGVADAEKAMTTKARVASLDKDAREYGGLYGYPKSVQSDIEATVRKFQKEAGKIARTAYGKHAKVAEFLSTHAGRTDSVPAHILVAALSEMGPKVAGEMDKQARLEELRAQRAASGDTSEMLQQQANGTSKEAAKMWRFKAFLEVDMGDPQAAARRLKGEHQGEWGIIFVDRADAQGLDGVELEGRVEPEDDARKVNIEDDLFNTLREVVGRMPRTQVDDLVVRSLRASDKEAGLRGKPAQILWAKMQNLSAGNSAQLTDLSASPEFRGIHFGRIMSAAEQLAKKGLITYDGVTLTLTGKKLASGSGSANARYLNSLPANQKATILKSMARHYGITPAEAEAELTDPDAEAAYEYLAADRSLAMKIHRDMRSGRFASDKEAARRYGLYGFSEKVANLGLRACSDVRSAAGRLAYDLHNRRGKRYAQITGYLDAHCKAENCRYSTLLRKSYPDDASSKTASEDAPRTVQAWLEWDLD